jgi:hypothetical protein
MLPLTFRSPWETIFSNPFCRPSFGVKSHFLRELLP